MDTKLKGWTARTGVKIISFLLILALFFIALYRFQEFEMRFYETGVAPDVVYSDLSTSRYFYDNHIGEAYNNSRRILDYKSEDSIIAGEHIQWISTDFPQNKYFYTYCYELMDSHLGITYGSFYNGEDTPELRASIERDAISYQLDIFRAALEYFRTTPGLIYYISDSNGTNGKVAGEGSDPAFVFSNVDVSRQHTEYFVSQPVYYVIDNDTRPFISYPADSSLPPYTYSVYHSGYYSGGLDRDSAIYLAFTNDEVSLQNSVYAEARWGYVSDLRYIAVSAVLILVCTVILLLGAGRRYSDESGTVHIALIGRPFLDISLAVVAGWSVLLLYLAYEFYPNIRYHRNISAMNTVLASLTVLIGTPVLLWLMSLSTRVKAGRFWRHTLIYTIPRVIARFFKSLWVGFPLMVKVSLIGLASLMMLICTSLSGYTQVALAVLFSIVFTVAVVILLLRYARRIHMLEQGARGVAGGAYSGKINAGGGELGSIAASVNNISDGINTAVEQRMKSERLKTELITNVSHDIRTPLTSIITYTDLLKHEGLGCEKAPEYLDILIQKSQRLQTLTDELFEAAKAATGNIEVNITELDIVSLINQILGELDGAVKSSGLDLRIVLPERLLVKADGKLMWRVMENLLSNVFKYSLPSSRVYLNVEQTGNAHIRIDLKNISAVELNVDPSELTERFKRGDDSRTGEGSGLGLSIVQSFVEAQGGKFLISIDGDLFKASVYLPVSQ